MLRGGVHDKRCWSDPPYDAEILNKYFQHLLIQIVYFQSDMPFIE